MKTYKIGILGAAGYVGGECLRLLTNHSATEIAWVTSKRFSGQLVSIPHPDMDGLTDLQFVGKPDVDVDIIFSCLPHGEFKKMLPSLKIDDHTKIIDLSQDHRMMDGTNGFLYGLPELNRSKIAVANRIANPGCFATAIELGLLPLAHCKKLPMDIQITAITGSTGAGVGLQDSIQFSKRCSNLSVYKPFTHQHLAEINEVIATLHPEWIGDVHLIPIRGPFTRGIFVSINFASSIDENILQELYEEFYASMPFTHVTSGAMELKGVVSTNHCKVQIKKYGKQVHIVSMIDNLLKGAAGQAVQNMNLMLGIPENMGLNLKASVF